MTYNRVSLFDSHTHLNADQFQGIESDIIRQAHEADVHYMAVVGFDYNTIERSLALSEANENIISAIGWHPTESYAYNQEVEDFLIEHLQHPRVHMLGEIGLDYYWDTSTKEEQDRAFRRQLGIARELNMPITIHNRDATADVYKVLREEGIPKAGGIMHSFGETEEEVGQFIDLGMHISFSGVLTFKKSDRVRLAAQLVPEDKLLIETDAPYLAPTPYRGKRNEPAYVREVAKVLAEVRGVSLEEIARVTTRNAMDLFNWHPGAEG